MENGFRFADALGPPRIVHLYAPSVGLKAIVVIDNVARGPSIGGVRMAPDVTLQECVRLVRAMTLKNAAAGLPHGGGKSVIIADPRMPASEKEDLIRAFAVAMRDLTDYIPGPDMGTDETCMAWVKGEIGRAAGLPKALGGIPLDEIGATGLGLAVAIEAALPFAGFALDGARVAVQGYGAVGRHAARFLAEKGARLVAAADTSGTVVNPNGLDLTRWPSTRTQGSLWRRFPVVRRATAMRSSMCPAKFGSLRLAPMCCTPGTLAGCVRSWLHRAPIFRRRRRPRPLCTSPAFWCCRILSPTPVA
jgi:glutamate dehydrogenase/leucine dehydrogenase